MNYLQYLLYALDTLYRYIKVYVPPLWTVIEQLTMMGVSYIRLGSGRTRAQGLENCKRPQEPLKLYELEPSPFCKKVREALTVLDIDHLVYPCPRETLTAYGVCLNSRFRPEVKKEGGIAMFPYLVDPNTNVKMYQSDDIVEYLWKTYGDKATPPLGYKLANNKLWNEFSFRVCLLLRPCLDMGYLRAPSRAPTKPLELFGYEASCTKRVCEVLSTLEIPYMSYVLPIGSVDKRKAFLKEHGDQISEVRKKLGFIRIPFLRDPNTGVEMFESKDIVRYLRDTYQTRPVPSESWLDALRRCA
eukprot:Blabericola_migrator_1__1935@NODE_1527_length_4338_cov_114_948958_g845_i2_p2_GENE_NODE_1527_length_4338_cov_114_948958_g845_i2NODE_1527_length_4338_cov_114_948958_g845_i2_p2_ORF_typecomplete_len301_score36_47GST_N_3/PF13417_6/3_5e12GST_N_3/PF13417_6/1_4e06GST_N/PF02798_20/0_022GST_N/PF02798_20/0_00026GST_N_2/PF13409_6/0_0094GST_N_2/PF13409_6/0_018MetRSN/PF09635_10/1_6e02MetRSN/PF09635_10/1_2_NODE_1527_length_4338_cov_114_948958_g845_i21461048